MKQITAVEWLVEQLKKRGYAGEFPPHLLFDQAKTIEKEQIVEAYDKGVKAGIGDYINTEWGRDANELTAEQYYTQTYKQK